MPGLARFARAELPLDRAENQEAKNPLGVDRVRVAPQRLDPGDAEHRGRFSTGGHGFGGEMASTFAGLSSARAHVRYLAPRPSASWIAVSPAAAPMR